MRRRGCEVLDTQSFLVADAEGPLEDGELDRAREWGASIAAALDFARPSSFKSAGG